MSITTETGTITLGDRTFTVRAFSLDQLQIIVDKFAQISQDTTLNNGGLTTMRDIIHAAISDQISRDELDALKIYGLPQIFAALPVIAETSGLVAVGELMRAKATPAP